MHNKKRPAGPAGRWVLAIDMTDAAESSTRDAALQATFAKIIGKLSVPRSVIIAHLQANGFVPEVRA